MRSRSALSLGSLLVLAGHLVGCDDPTGPKTPDPITELPRALTAAEELVIAHSNAFGLKLLREVDAARTAEQPNTVLSPLSVSMALGMALEGADGETFTELRDALGFEGLAREDINASYEGLLDLLPNLDPAVELGIANSAWSRLGFPFLATYFDTITNHFDAAVQELDFNDPGAKDVINQWVQEETEGRIDEIIQEISRFDVLFLVNTVYFKGSWTTQFKKQDTHEAPFYLEDGGSVDVPMMTGTIPKVGYAWLDGRRVVAELPYGGQAFGLVLVAPAPDETVDDLMSDLDDAVWSSWMSSLHPQEEVDVQMPTFEEEWDGWLTEPLKALGVEKAFKPLEADFSRMTPVPETYISRIRQSTYLRVDEEGTEAAAATSVVMQAESAPPALELNRPFLLAIRERLSGTVLFIGAIRDPR